MRRPHVLIVYGSSHGQTARIARRMADVLIMLDHAVTLVKGDELPPGFSPDGYDAAIVGASVLLGRHQRYVEAFAQTHRAFLERVPSAFFSVSGSLASDRPEYRALADRYVREFVTRTGWHPSLSAAIAGAVAYTKYGPLLRWFMKLISARTGRPTDTSRDHEFTDWAQVECFAEAFAALIPRLGAPAAPPLAGASART